jgi:hypothetical protein
MNNIDGTWTVLSQRLLRLYACACCRRTWDRLALDCRLAVEAAERFADRRIDRNELDEAWRAAKRLEGLRRRVPIEESERAPSDGQARGLEFYQYTEQVHRVAAPTFTLEDAWTVTHDLRPWQGDSLDNVEADAAHDRIFRDVFGGPARPVVLDPAWRTPEVQSLAVTIYEQRQFARLSDLADALVAAGCLDIALLSHCRSGQQHVRGCWALDGVLGLH